MAEVGRSYVNSKLATLLNLKRLAAPAFTRKSKECENPPSPSSLDSSPLIGALEIGILWKERSGCEYPKLGGDGGVVKVIGGMVIPNKVR